MKASKPLQSTTALDEKPRLLMTSVTAPLSGPGPQSEPGQQRPLFASEGQWRTTEARTLFPAGGPRVRERRRVCPRNAPTACRLNEGGRDT
jgi:hypothetical protein